MVEYLKKVMSMKYHKNILNVKSYNRKELKPYVGKTVTITAYVSNEFNTPQWRLLKSCYIKDFNINIDHLWVSSYPLEELGEGPYTLKAKITKYKNENKYGIEVIQPKLRKNTPPKPQPNADSELSHQVEIITDNIMSIIMNSPEAHLYSDPKVYNTLKLSNSISALINPEINSDPVTIVKRFAYNYKEIWTKHTDPFINDLLIVYHFTSGTFVDSLMTQEDLQNLELQEAIWKFGMARNSISASSHPTHTYKSSLQILEKMDQNKLIVLILMYLIKNEIEVLDNHHTITKEENSGLVSKMKSLLGL